MNSARPREGVLRRLAGVIAPPDRKSAAREIRGCFYRIVVVVAGFAFISYQSYQTAVASWLQIVDATATAVGAYTEQSLSSSALVLKRVVSAIEDADIESSDDLRRLAQDPRLTETMRQIIRNERQIDVSSLIAVDGTLTAYTRSYPPPPQNLGDRDYFAAALEKPATATFLSEPVQNKTNGDWTFYLSHPVLSKVGNVVGVAIVGLQTKYFSDVYRLMLPNPGTAVTLYKSSGIVLSRTSQPEQTIGRSRTFAILNSELETNPSPPARIIRSNETPGALTVSQTRIVALRKLHGYPAVITVAVSSETYLQTWWRANLFVGLATLAVIAGIVFSTRRTLLFLADKEVSDRLEQDRRLLSAIVETPSSLTAVIDRDGRVVHANKLFWSTFSGLERDGADILASPSVRGAAPMVQFADAAASPAGDQTRRFEVQIARPDRKIFLSFFATRQALSGIGDCAVIIGHDETERLEVQAALVHSARLVTLGEMTTSIAHEISQPLFAISLSAQNALEDVRQNKAEPPALAALIERIEQKLAGICTQIGRAMTIAQNMRVFGRSTDAGPIPFDVRDSCQRAVDLVREQVRLAGIELTVELGSTELIAKGAQNSLEQVIVNLLLNARDALREHPAVRKTIALSARLEEASGTVVISVADNGPGVPESIRERIFEPFFTTKPVGQGMGLGLSISYGMVRDMGGKLTLLPDTAGAVFEIRLPTLDLDEMI
jgi:signal transduction histidine kinase